MLTSTDKQAGHSRTSAVSLRAAITGAGCRLPGASNLDEFWELIISKRHGLRHSPPGRYEALELTPHYIQSLEEIGHHWGGYIDGPDLFDPVVFGMSRAEASTCDPQHRLLLEVVWEALENACEAPASIAGSRTGVFVGLSSFDYTMFQAAFDPYGTLVTPLTTAGGAHSIAANRISYLFDLRGPSLAIDTACSSSSHALHMALRSLQHGECDAAIVCGANMIMSPYLTKGFKRARMLAKDGLVKCFDEKTDGYVRAEGAVAILIRREEDAIARGNRIMGVICSSAINHDGKTAGMVMPCAERQIELITGAQTAAGVEPSQIGFVEAHGTGTYRGDETELGALNEIFTGARAAAIFTGGRNHPGDATAQDAKSHGTGPCYVGSVKANLGHLEAVSGLAGVLKTLLCLQKGQIPGQANLTRPMPVAFADGSRVVVPMETAVWPRGAQPRRAGVSCLGFGGANSHLVIEEAPAPVERAVRPDRPVHVLKLSAKSTAQVALMAGRLKDALAHQPDLALGDICHSLNIGRADLEERALIVSRSREDLSASLAALADGPAAATIATGRAPRAGRKVAFVFCGDATAYHAMGRGLYDAEPVFAEWIDAADDALSELVRSSARDADVSLRELLFGGPAGEPAGEPVADPALARVALFATQYATASLLLEFGVKPAFQIGSGIGAYVVAALEQRLSIADALKAAFHGEPEGSGAELTDALERAIADGADVVLEPGPPSPLLAQLAMGIAEREIKQAVCLSPGGNDCETLAATLGLLYTAGVNIDWEAMDAPFQRRRLALPTYPFARERFWFTDEGKAPGTTVTQAEAAAEAGAKQPPDRNPLEAGAPLPQHSKLPLPQRSKLPLPQRSILPLPQHCELPLMALRWRPADAAVANTGGGRATLGAVAAGAQQDGIGAPVEWPGEWYGAALASGGQDLAARFVAAAKAADSGPVDHAGDADQAVGSARPRVGKGVILIAAGPGHVSAPQTNDDADDAGRTGWELCRTLLLTMQKLAQRSDITRVLVVTSKAQQITDGETGMDPGQGALWGFCRTLQWEYPQWNLSLVDLDERTLTGDLAPLMAQLLRADGPRQLAVRDGAAYVPRLLQHEATGKPAFTKPNATSEPATGGRDTYLVTGGLGALGLVAAQWLVERGAARIVLASRRAPSPEVSARIDALSRCGAQVETIELDVCDRDALAACFARIDHDGDVLKGVIHAAGVLDDALLPSLSEQMAAKVFHPKATAAWDLHQLTKDRPLDLFVCFSSISAILGSPGQAHYAAANAYLDTLCQMRRAEGLPALSINWGPWASGMAGSSATGRRFEQMGFGGIEPEAGIAAMEAALSANEPCVLVADADWAKIKTISRARAGFDLLDEIVSRPAQGAATDAGGQSSATAISRPELFQLLRDSLAAATSIPLGEIGEDTIFTDVALDSLAGLELLLRLENRLGIMPDPEIFAEDMTFGAAVDALLEVVKTSVRIKPARPQPISARPNEAKAPGLALSQDAPAASQTPPQEAPPNHGARPQHLNGSGAPAGADLAVAQTLSLLEDLKAQIDPGDYLTFIRPDYTMALHEMLLDVDYDVALGDHVSGTRFGEKINAIDMLGGFGSTLFGHNHPALVGVLRALLAEHRPKFVQMANRSAAGTLAKELIAKVAKVTGRDYKAVLGNTGAEMVDAALKHALFEWSQRRDDFIAALAADDAQAARPDFVDEPPVVLALEGSYHGKTLGAYSLTWNAPGRDGLGLKGPFEVIWLPRDDAAAAREIFERYQYHGTLDQAPPNAGTVQNGAAPAPGPRFSRIAGLFLEPILGEGGIFQLSKGYAGSLRALADDAGCPLVIDEIQSGMGRAGAFTAASLIDLRGDYYLFGKSLGGGLSKTSALLIDAERYAKGYGFAHTSTFGEDDHGAFIALRALRLLDEDKIEARARDAGSYLVKGLQDVKSRYPRVLLDVRGCGLMIGIELADQSGSTSGLISGLSQQGLLGLFVASHLLHRQGLRIGTALSRPSTLRLEPSAYISRADMDSAVSGIAAVCKIIDAGDAADLVRHLAQSYRMSGRSPFAMSAPPGSGKHHAGLKSGSSEAHVPGAATARPAGNLAVFLGHMLDTDDIGLLDKSLLGLSLAERENLTERMYDPVLIKHVAMRSSSGESLNFEVHTLPLTSRAIVTALRGGQGERIVLQVKAAIERFASQGARVVGLGGLLSVITRNGLALSGEFPDLQITTGNTYTVALAAEAVVSTMRDLNIDAAASRIGVVGAGGNIGSTLVHILAQEFGRFHLIGRKASISRVEKVADAVYDAALAQLRWHGRQAASGLAAALCEPRFAAFVDRCNGGTAAAGPGAGLNGAGANGKCLNGTRLDPADLDSTGLDGRDLDGRNLDATGPTAGARLRRMLIDEFGTDPLLPVSPNIEDLDDCNVIVSASNSIAPILMPSNVGRATRIICDVSVPSDVDPGLITARPDIVVIRGGVAKAPDGNCFTFDMINLPENHLLACMTETALLGFAGRQGFSGTGEIHPSGVRECHELGRRLGFGLGYFAVEKPFAIELG